MSQSTLRPEAVDRLLADFFEAQLPQPWPPAPRTPAAEPSVLAVTQAAAVTPRPRPGAPADRGTRARLTLAASVAFLLGTCWYLSSGSPPDGRPTKPGAGGPNVLPDATAKTPREFNKRAEKAKEATDPMAGFKPGSINLP